MASGAKAGGTNMMDTLAPVSSLGYSLPGHSTGTEDPDGVVHLARRIPPNTT